MSAAERAKAAIDVAAAFDPADAEAHVVTPHGWLAKAAECDAWSLAALGTTDAAAWRAAASACVEAWQASRGRADVQEEAEAAVEVVVADCLEQRRRVSADMLRESVRSGDSLLFERLGHALSDALVYQRKNAQRNALTAIEAVARWRRAEMDEGKGT